MKKRFFAMAALLVLVLCVSAQAIEPLAVKVTPILKFDGTMAECSVVCNGSSRSDEIDATLTLYHGDDVVDSWSNSGTYRVSVSGECRVVRGEEYTLEVTWSINGVRQQSTSTVDTCPMIG